MKDDYPIIVMVPFLVMAPLMSIVFVGIWTVLLAFVKFLLEELVRSVESDSQRAHDSIYVWDNIIARDGARLDSYCRIYILEAVSTTNLNLPLFEYSILLEFRDRMALFAIGFATVMISMGWWPRRGLVARIGRSLNTTLDFRNTIGNLLGTEIASEISRRGWWYCTAVRHFYS